MDVNPKDLCRIRYALDQLEDAYFRDGIRIRKTVKGYYKFRRA